MTIINTSTHKVLLKTGGTSTELGQIAHFFIRDFFAAEMVSSGILPVTISNTSPTLSRLVIWFDPNGTTTTDAENLEGAFNISNNGTSWIANPTPAQWRAWLQFYLAAASSVVGGTFSIESKVLNVNETWWLPIGNPGCTIQMDFTVLANRDPNELTYGPVYPWMFISTDGLNPLSSFTSVNAFVPGFVGGWDYASASGGVADTDDMLRATFMHKKRSGVFGPTGPQLTLCGPDGKTHRVTNGVSIPTNVTHVGLKHVPASNAYSPQLRATAMIFNPS